MTLLEYLATFREDCSEWLVNIDINNPVFSREDFFNSRVVFYPGAYVDGHAIKLFGSSHAAHCFVYCDYRHEQNEIRAILDGNNTGYSSPIKGYLRCALYSMPETSVGQEVFVGFCRFRYAIVRLVLR